MQQDTYKLIRNNKDVDMWEWWGGEDYNLLAAIMHVDVLPDNVVSKIFSIDRSPLTEFMVSVILDE